MKIQVTKKTETVEEIELDLPAYFKDEYNLFEVSESRITQVSKSANLLLFHEEGLFFEHEIKKVTQCQPSNIDEFEKTYSLFIGKLNHKTI